MDGGGIGPAGGGSGRPTAPMARLTQCDEQAIVYEHPLIGRIGFFIIACFLFLFFTPLCITAIQSGVTLGSVLFSLAVLVVLSVLVYFGIRPVTLSIDPAQRRHRLRRGWPPLGTVIEGGVDDFSRLSLKMYDNGPRGTTLLLHWADRKKEPFELHSASREEARLLGDRVAFLLGLPFDDSARSSVESLPSEVPNARLVPCDATSVLSERPWQDRLVIGIVGLFFGLVVIGIAMRGVFASESPSDPVIIPYLLFGLVGIGFAAGSYFTMGPQEFYVHVPTGIYQERRGLWPFRRVRGGTIDEFDRLALWDFSAGRGGAALVLHWRDWRRPPVVLHVSRQAPKPAQNREDVRERGQEVASLLNLPLVDEKGAPLLSFSEREATSRQASER